MKRLLTVLLAVLMMFSLAACSSGKTEEPTDTTTTVKVGMSGPLTGGAAVYGIAVRNAAEIAVAEVNAKGGIQIEFKMEDDEATPEKAVTAYGNLVDWGMQAGLITVTSGAGAAVAPLYVEDGYFGITPSGSSTALVYTEKTNYESLFQMCFTDPNQGVASADYIAENFAGAKVAIIYRNDDVYSTGIYDKFMSQAKTKGVNVVYEAAFIESDTDFSVALQQAKAAGADLIFLPIYYQPAALILTQAKAMDYAPTFFGVDGMDGILTLEGFDTTLAEGVYLLTPFAADAKDELTQNFVKTYTEKYGETPNQFAADAYDCIYAIHAALTAAGITSSSTQEEITSALVSQFTTMTFDGLTGTSVTWAVNGEVSKAPKAVIITDGVYVSAK